MWMRNPILSHCLESSYQSRTRKKQPLTYCTPPIREPNTIIHDRRINFYRFLLNDFKSFDSLFKVLFIFPSQYLFAIGFPYIFSLRRNVSPSLGLQFKTTRLLE